MYIVHWLDQTHFGPFHSINAAQTWVEKMFGMALSDDSNFKIIYVERPEPELIS